MWTTAGEALATLPVADVKSVRALKKRLHRLCGHSRFRQRLIHNGCVLEDSDRLNGLAAPIDLQIVLLPYFNACSDQLQSWRPRVLALTEACAAGNLAVAEEILQLPVDPNIFGDVFPPLIAACAAGHVEVVRLLLEAGADRNIKCFGWTPEMSALAGWNIQVLLLLRGAYRWGLLASGSFDIFVAFGLWSSCCLDMCVLPQERNLTAAGHASLLPKVIEGSFWHLQAFFLAIGLDALGTSFNWARPPILTIAFRRAVDDQMSRGTIGFQVWLGEQPVWSRMIGTMVWTLARVFGASYFRFPSCVAYVPLLFCNPYVPWVVGIWLKQASST